MTKQSIQTIFAFIITILMFAAMPGIADAQKKCPNGHCPKGYTCVDGTCVKFGGGCNCLVRPIPFACGQICGFFAGTSEDELISTSTINTDGIGFELTQAQNISFKIYDITGRLIKTLSESWMPQGEHRIKWNKKDEAGNTVSAGIYILQFDAGTYSGSKKLSVVN